MPVKIQGDSALIMENMDEINEIGHGIELKSDELGDVLKFADNIKKINIPNFKGGIFDWPAGRIFRLDQDGNQQSLHGKPATDETDPSLFFIEINYLQGKKNEGEFSIIFTDDKLTIPDCEVRFSEHEFRQAYEQLARQNENESSGPSM